ncbi:MAG: hypothetical protein Ta2E_01160 [Mycoplasmoidaceae bacterium]|nr:MAG: hypothetical protein Ta2E_01160 [Mycoplasmoidaceae bacterium]
MKEKLINSWERNIHKIQRESECLFARTNLEEIARQKSELDALWHGKAHWERIKRENKKLQEMKNCSYQSMIEASPSMISIPTDMEQEGFQ